MEAQSLFFLSGLRKQVIYVRTHNKSISKLDLIKVLTVFSSTDTALLFYCNFTTTWVTLAGPFQKKGNVNTLMLLFLKIM